MTIWLAIASMGAVATPTTLPPPRAHVVPLLPLTYDVGETPMAQAPLVRPAADDDVGNPLAISAIDDGYQRLRLGIAPGGRARLGVSYRLSFGD